MLYYSILLHHIIVYSTVYYSSRKVEMKIK